MTIKTPQEIAREVLALNLSVPDDAYKSAEALRQIDYDGATVLAMLRTAVEADRAQRREIDQDWRDDQENVRDADHVSVSWTAHDSRGRNTFQSDMVITAKQAVGMFQGIGEA